MGEGATGIELIRQRVIEQLCDIAFTDATEFVRVNRDGELQFVPTEALERGKQSAIASIKMGSKGVELRCYDKNRALYLLMQLLGFGAGWEREVEDLGPRDTLLAEDGDAV